MKIVGAERDEDGWRTMGWIWLEENGMKMIGGRMVGGGWDLRMVGVKQDRMDILYCTLYNIR
jgi:hypothetical protein